MRVCNGICLQYEVTKTKNGWYVEGVKRCHTCEIFIKWNNIKCPCCKGRLSGRPKRTSKNVKRYGEDD